MGGPRRRGAPMPPMSFKGQGKILKRLMGIVMRRYALHFAIVVVCILVTALCTLQGTLFTRTLIDDYILPLVADAQSGVTPDFGPLAHALTRLAIILSVGILCSYGYNRIMVNVSQGTMLNIRTSLFTHMQSLPIKYFDTHAHGDIMSIYTNDVDTLRMLIGNTIPQVINSAITIVITFYSMITLSWPMTILSLLLLGVMMLSAGKLAGLSGKYFSAQQKNLGIVNGYIEEMMQGQKVVKVFCHEDKSLEKFRELNENLRSTAYNANRFANVLGPINNNLGHISYVVCAVFGSALNIFLGAGWMTIGTLVSYLTLNRNFTQPVTQITQQMNAIVMAMAGARRVFDLMDADSEADEGYVELVRAVELPDGTIRESDKRTGLWAWKHPHHDDGTVTYTKLEGGVVFDDVDFGYTEEKTILHNITMYAMPGQKIAFVGGTGAGKTTITNLINRFYDIQDGKIRYDGINVNKIRKADLRRSLGMVLQDTHLFTGTVLDNIRYGRLDATDEECIEAAKLANADSFIRRLPEGYNTMLTGDGANLSQGQRQLLAIARAAVADPPALILDEATSSIDTRTEALVQSGMDALMKGRTTFVIAHRLSTVKNSDCIMVLEQGRIIERGTHDELIEQKGKYYQLYTGNAIAS
ncbi:MAG: ABC transporter ATP-binding protein [Christensenellaceae bacterium]|nr:ABC transporter ATP-binding protein [Christensenellaceae bacterium]